MGRSGNRRTSIGDPDHPCRQVSRPGKPQRSWLTAPGPPTRLAEQAIGHGAATGGGGQAADSPLSRRASRTADSWCAVKKPGRDLSGFSRCIKATILAWEDTTSFPTTSSRWTPMVDSSPRNSPTLMGCLCRSALKPAANRHLSMTARLGTILGKSTFSQRPPTISNADRRTRLSRVERHLCDQHRVTFGGRPDRAQPHLTNTNQSIEALRSTRQLTMIAAASMMCTFAQSLMLPQRLS